ncbi:hypothetical protein [Thermodesulfitimonas sp.]
MSTYFLQEEARYDGKYVLRTNTTLRDAAVAIGYKSFWQVEHTFWGLNQGRTWTGLPLHVTPLPRSSANPEEGCYST